MLFNKTVRSSNTSTIPEFIASSYNYSTNGTPVASKPAGTAEGDMIIAYVFAASGAYFTSIPSGFIHCGGYIDNSQSSQIFYKIAGASEPSTYTFASSNTGDRVSASLLTYRNATKINASSNSFVTSTTIPASSISPDRTGVLIAAYSMDSPQTIDTPPSGMTERENNNNSQNFVVIYDEINRGIGSTGNRDLVLAGSTNVIATLIQIVNDNRTNEPYLVASASAYQSNGDTNAEVAKPTGTTEGDIMIAVMAVNDNVTTWTQPSGWTELLDQNSSPSVAISYKVAGASEPATYIFTPAAPKDVRAAIVTFRGASYDSFTATTTQTDFMEMGSATSSASNSVAVVLSGQDSSTIAFSAATGLTEILSTTSSATVMVAYKSTGSGDTGWMYFGDLGNIDAAGGVVVIKPA